MILLQPQKKVATKLMSHFSKLCPKKIVSQLIQGHYIFLKNIFNFILQYTQSACIFLEFSPFANNFLEKKFPSNI